MNFIFLIKAGMFLLGGLILWSFVCCDYGIAEIYNLREKKEYKYMGILKIDRKEGEFYLRIPKKMVERSYTTQYKIVPEYFFRKEKEGKGLRINFAGKKEFFVEIAENIMVKNYIATSNQL